MLTDDEPARGPGEASVRDESRLSAQPGTHESGSLAQHLQYVTTASCQIVVHVQFDLWLQTSGIPGAPLGPWYRKMTTIPAVTSPFSSASKNGGMLDDGPIFSTTVHTPCHAA